MSSDTAKYFPSPESRAGAMGSDTAKYFPPVEYSADSYDPFLSVEELNQQSGDAITSPGGRSVAPVFSRDKAKELGYDDRESAIVDRHLAESGGTDTGYYFGVAKADMEIAARRQQRAYAEEASLRDPDAYIATTKMLLNTGRRNEQLDAYRKMTPEQREEALRLAPGIAQQLGDDRGGLGARLLDAVARGAAAVSQPVMEIIGAGGTAEEIDYLHKLNSATQEFAPAREGDPVYQSAPLQAVEMMPWMATVVGGNVLGSAAGKGAGMLLGRAAASGVPGAKAAFQAAGAIGKLPSAIGLKAATTKGVFGGVGGTAGGTIANFPGAYAQEVDQLKGIGMEDGQKLRMLAAGTAVVNGLIESGIVGNPFAVGQVPLREGALKAARQYLWEAAKNAPGEFGEEYVQGVASGLGQHVAQYLDENAKEKTVSEAFKKGWDQMVEAGPVLGLMLGVPAVGGASAAAIRARRIQLENIRSKGFVSEADAKDAGVAGANRRERMANVESEINRLSAAEDEQARLDAESDRQFAEQQAAGEPAPPLAQPPAVIPEDEADRFRREMAAARGAQVAQEQAQLSPEEADALDREFAAGRAAQAESASATQPPVVATPSALPAAAPKEAQQQSPFDAPEQPPTASSGSQEPSSSEAERASPSEALDAFGKGLTNGVYAKIWNDVQSGSLQKMDKPPLFEQLVLMGYKGGVVRSLEDVRSITEGMTGDFNTDKEIGIGNINKLAMKYQEQQAAPSQTAPASASPFAESPQDEEDRIRTRDESETFVAKNKLGEILRSAGVKKMTTESVMPLIDDAERKSANSKVDDGVNWKKVREVASRNIEQQNKLDLALKGGKAIPEDTPPQEISGATQAARPPVGKEIKAVWEEFDAKRRDFFEYADDYTETRDEGRIGKLQDEVATLDEKLSSLSSGVFDGESEELSDMSPEQIDKEIDFALEKKRARKEKNRKEAEAAEAASKLRDEASNKADEEKRSEREKETQDLQESADRINALVGKKTASNIDFDRVEQIRAMDSVSRLKLLTKAAEDRYIADNYTFTEEKAPGGKIVGVRRNNTDVPDFQLSGRSKAEVKKQLLLKADEAVVASYAKTSLKKPAGVQPEKPAAESDIDALMESIMSQMEDQPSPQKKSPPSGGAKQPSKSQGRKSDKTRAEAASKREEARRAMADAFKDSQGRLPSGLDIDLATKVAKAAKLYIESGALEFKAFIENLAEDFGDTWVRDKKAYLESAWRTANKLKWVDSPVGKVDDLVPAPEKEQAASKPISEEQLAAEREGDVDKTLRQAGLKVEQLSNGTWQITGNTYEHSKEIGDVKREIRELGGYWDRSGKRWTFKADPRRAIADRLISKGVGKEPGDAGVSDEQMARERARREQDEKADVQTTRDTYVAGVDQSTRDLILRGRNYGMTDEVIDNQIEDIGRVVNAAENGRPMFVIGSAPGTGKTFVLGGAIRELRRRGFKRFVYVTQNEDLIDQVKRNLADYGLDGVEFTTYSKTRTSPVDASGAVLLLDEAHTAKNSDRETGKRISGMVKSADFTVYATATPFENVTEAEYIGFSGVFDDLKVSFTRPSTKPGGRPFRNELYGFKAWAWMFGANVYFIKQEQRGQTVFVPMVWWDKHQTSEESQLAANEWLKKRGVFVQRPMSLPVGMVNTEFREVKADQYWADISNKVADIYDEAMKEAEGGFEKGQVKAHRENTLKRLLEASKVDAAIARAKELIGEGKESDPQVIIFVNTKEATDIGSYSRSKPYLEEYGIKGKEAKQRFTPAEMDEMMQKWYQAKAIAKKTGDNAGPPPFAPFVHKIAMAMDAAGVMEKFPSVIDKIMEAFPGQAVEYSGRTASKNASNLDEWKNNEAKLIVATMAKGGTGLSFHDTTGKMPSRYQVNMNLPWSGTQVEQVSGRLARYGTAKPVSIEWLFASNIPFDRRLAKTVGSRMRSMAAAVQGRMSGEAKQIKDFDFTDAMDEAESRVELPWSGSTVEDENRWAGTSVSVSPKGKEEAYTGTVDRVLNGGDTVEVRREGFDSSVRVPSERVSVIDLKDSITPRTASGEAVATQAAQVPQRPTTAKELSKAILDLDEKASASSDPEAYEPAIEQRKEYQDELLELRLSQGDKYTIVVVGCCDKKATGKRKASDLYQSDLFKKSAEYAKNNSDEWVIASALHGIITPGYQIEPYDQRLGKSKADIERAKGMMNVLGIAPKAAFRKPKGGIQEVREDAIRVVILAGKDYAEAIKASLPSGIEVVEPLKGKEIGQRLQWLSEQNSRKTKKPEEVLTGEESGREEPGAEEQPATGAVEQDRGTIYENAVEGKSTKINTADGKTLKATYYAVEADSLIPSHDARRNFAMNEGAVIENEKPYHDPIEGAAPRRKVMEISELLEDKIGNLTSDDITPVNGPPVVDQFKVVLGGNARSMGMQLAYAGPNAAILRNHMLSQAEKFGIDRTQVEGIKNPVIIRVVEDVFDKRTISALLNESLAAAKSRATIASSQAKRVSKGTIDLISGILSSDDSPSLREAMANPTHSDRIVRAIVNDGAWSDRETNLYVDPATGDLNPDGKSAIESLLVAKIIPDVTVLGNAAPTVKQKLLFAIAPLVEGISDKEFGKKIADSVSLAVKAYDGYVTDKASGGTLQTYFIDQKQFFEEVPGFGDYAVASIVYALNTLSPTQFRNAMQDVVSSLGIGVRTKSLFEEMNVTYGSVQESLKNVLNPPLRSSPDVLLQVDDGIKSPPSVLLQKESDVYAPLRSEAIKIGLAAEKAGIKYFDDFIAYTLSTVGEEKTRQLGAYLKLIGDMVGMKSVRPVGDILGGLLVTEEQYKEHFKKAFQRYSQEQIDVLSELSKITAFGRQEVGFAPAGSPVPRQSMFQALQPRLSVLHNISADGLVFADKIGGLAVPSLAIVKDDMGLEGFGEITLIGKSSMVDPRLVEVYDSDAYTSRFPRPEYKKVKSSVAQKLVDELRPWVNKFSSGRSVMDEVYDNAVNKSKPQDTIYSFLNSNAVKAWFLSDKGVSASPAMSRVRPRWDWTYGKAWLQFVKNNDHNAMMRLGYDDPVRARYMKDAGDAAVESMRENANQYKKAGLSQEEIDEFVQQGKENFTDSDGALHYGYLDAAVKSAQKKGESEVDLEKTRKKLDRLIKNKEGDFKEWVEGKILPMYGSPFLTIGKKRLDYNLENIVEHMTSKGVRGQEKTMTFSEGKARAAASTRISSMEQMRNMAGSLARESDVEQAMVESKKAMESWRASVVDYYGDGSYGSGRVWDGMDASMRAIAKWAKGRSLADALRSEGFRGVPKDVVNEGVEAGRKLMQAPVPYFEAKPGRIVMLSEFTGAVIPRNAPASIRSILKKHGVPFRTYSSSLGEGEKARVVSSFRNELAGKLDGVLFQRENRIPLYIAKNLTADELANLRSDTIDGIVSHFQSLPPQADFEEAAKAGVAKRGWYRRAAESLRQLFGSDAEIFVRLLAATSPRQGVTENLSMSLRIWIEWNKAGRPVDAKGIKNVLRPIPGAMFGSRIKNTVRALQGKGRLSGYKVNSFSSNLLGDFEAVTNDAWMAAFAGIDQKVFGTKAGYLAFNAKVRKTASKLGISPAEVQEAIWSFAKTLSALRTGGRTSKEALAGMTHESVAMMPEFSQLIIGNENVKQLLNQLGLKDAVSRIAVEQAKAKPEFSGRITSDRPAVLERIARRVPAGAGGRGVPGAVARAGLGSEVDTLYQEGEVENQEQDGNVKGWTRFITATRALIGATSKADVSTFIHEFAHPMRRFLLDKSVPQSKRADITDEEISMLEEKCGVDPKTGVWEVENEERFAKMWEQYWFEGKSPNAVLDSLFEKISRWMQGVYESIKQITGSDKPLDPEVQKLFDKLVQRGLTVEERASGRGRSEGDAGAPPRSTAAPGLEWVENLTSIANAVTADARAALSLPGHIDVTSQSFEQWIDEASQLLRVDPNLGDRLVRELSQSDRNVTHTEVAVLQIHFRHLKNLLDAASDRLFAAKDAGDDVAAAKARLETDAIVNQIEDLTDITKKVGTASGRALVARRIMMESDFSLAGLTRMARIANAGNVLNEEQQAEIESLARQIAKIQGDLEKQIQKTNDLERQLAVQQSIEEDKNEAEKRPVRGTSRSRAKERLSGFAKLFGFGKKDEDTGTLKQSEDERMADEAEGVIRAYVDSGVYSFGELMAKVKQDLGADIPIAARVAFSTAWGKMKAQGGIPVPSVIDRQSSEIRNIAKMIQRSLVESGITDRDEVIDAVHESLQEIIPDMTRRETMDAMSGYGQYSEASSDPVDVIIRDLNGQYQQMAKLDDMRQGIAPRKTGVERRTPSPQERELIQKVNQMKKDSKYFVTDPETQLRTIFQATMTSLKNRIYDLSRAINIAETPIPGRGSVTFEGREAEQVAAFRKLRDELMAEYKQMFPKPGATFEQRAAAVSRALDRAISDIEQQIESGDVAPKQQAERISTSEIEAKRARLEALKKQRDVIREQQNPKMTKEERDEKAYIANLLNRIADYEDRKARGYFGPRPKKEPRDLSEKELILKKQLDDLKDEFFRLAAEYRLRNMTPAQKAWDYTKETMHLARAIMTSFDLSAVFRQGGIASFSHPVLAAKSSVKMLSAALRSQSEFNTMEKIQADDDYPLAMRADLAITTEGEKITRQEEAYMGRLVRSGIGKKGTKINTFTRGLLTPVSASARAYTTFLNSMRFQLFKYMVSNLGANGQVTIDEAKVIATYINVATGRADLGSWNQAMANLNTVFFAPRYVTSRFQYLAMPFYILPSTKVSGRVKKMIAMEYARHALGLASFLGLSVALGSLLTDDEEEKPTVELDPRSSDWMKLRIGETRIDPMAGLSQSVTLIGQITTGQKKQITGGMKALYGKDRKFGDPDLWDVFTDFGRKKLAPVPGAMIDLMVGENVIGEKETPLSVATGLFIPLSGKEVIETMRARGFLGGGPLVSVLSLLGMGGGTYGPRTAYAGGDAAKREELFSKALDQVKWDSPDLPYKDFLTAGQVDKFNKRREAKKQSLVYAASASPKRKDYRSDESFADSVEEQKKAMEAVVKSGMGYEEIRQMLLGYYKRNYGSAYEMRGGAYVMKESLVTRLRQIKRQFSGK